MLRVACVLLLAAVVVVSAQDPPVMPEHFTVKFKEHTKQVVSHDNTGVWYYNGESQERIDRDNARGDRYCAPAHPIESKNGCIHLVPDGVHRYLIWPHAELCCMCCTNEKGCGSIKRDWLANAQYDGKEAVGSHECNKWEIKGLQSNFWYQSDEGVPCRFNQEPNDDQVFNYDSFSTDPIDDSVFAVPEYCSVDKHCPTLSICTLVRENPDLDAFEIRALWDSMHA